MRDSEVAASIVAGDPDGLAAAYDRYADPLYKYCRSMLSDPADAADAVQDTFVVAASRLARLRDPDQLRAWLYAVARNECLRIRRSAKGTSALSGAPEVVADTVGDAGSAELGALLEDAAGGLDPGEREVIELWLRQGLEPAEVATVLGVSRNHADSSLSRARDQLAACLGALLVGRAGRDDCGELGSLLAGWDGRLTVLLRKRVHRHIEQCATCTSRRASELRPETLPDLSPGSALAAAATESLRRAAGAPAGLREHTLALATAQGPAAVAHRAAVLSRASDFTRHGFPRVLSQGTAKAGARSGHHGRAGGAKGMLRTPRGQATAAAAVVLAVIAAMAAVALTGNTGQLTSTAAAKPSAGASPPLATAAKPKPTLTPSSPPASPDALATVPTALPTPTAPGPAATPTEASPAPAPTTPSPTPTRATPSQSPTPPPGSLALFPAGGTQARPAPLGVMPGGHGTTIYLFAIGSGSDWAVNWSVTVANDPGHVITVSPASSGTLTPASPKAKVTITASQPIQCGHRGEPACPTITISPGGAVYVIWTSWKRPFTGHGTLASRPPA